MVFKKKEKVEVVSAEKVEAETVEKTEITPETEAPASVEASVEPAVIAGVEPKGRSFTDVEVETMNDMILVYTNMLRQSNNPLMRRDIKKFIHLLGSFIGEAKHD